MGKKKRGANLWRYITSGGALCKKTGSLDVVPIDIENARMMQAFVSVWVWVYSTPSQREKMSCAHFRTQNKTVKEDVGFCIHNFACTGELNCSPDILSTFLFFNQVFIEDIETIHG